MMKIINYIIILIIAILHFHNNNPVLHMHVDLLFFDDEYDYQYDGGDCNVDD